MSVLWNVVNWAKGRLSILAIMYPSPVTFRRARAFWNSSKFGALKNEASREVVCISKLSRCGKECEGRWLSVERACWFRLSDNFLNRWLCRLMRSAIMDVSWPPTDREIGKVVRERRSLRISLMRLFRVTRLLLGRISEWITISAQRGNRCCEICLHWEQTWLVFHGCRFCFGDGNITGPWIHSSNIIPRISVGIIFTLAISEFCCSKSVDCAALLNTDDLLIKKIDVIFSLANNFV